jgi:hypothetical protein
MDNVFLQVWYVLKKYLHITFANIFMDARFPYTDDSYLLPENSKMIKTLYNLELIVWEIRYRYIAKELNLGKFDIKQIMIYKNIIRYTKSLKYIDKKLFYEFFDLKNNGTFLDWIYFIVLRDIIFKIVIKNNAGLLLNTANVVNRFKQKKLILWQISFYQRYYKYRSYELTNPSMLALDFSIPVNAKYAPFYNYKGI